MDQRAHPNVPVIDQSDRLVPRNLRQSGTTPMQLLLSTRVRKSPFWHLSVEAGCWRATVYNRMYHPRGYARPDEGGAMAEYDALVNRVTLWDLAVERQIRVRGPQAEAFVNFVITRDATKIPPMHAKYAILCNEKGGIPRLPCRTGYQLLSGLDDTPESAPLVGMAATLEHARRLIAYGAPALHVYSLNRWPLPFALARLLGHPHGEAPPVTLE